MKIGEIIIGNYRNLSGVRINLNPNINFLVGENDLGKSNLLDLLDIILHGKRFNENDFLEKDKPISIEFSIILSDSEKGIFEDYFDPSQNDRINIITKQDSIDDEIKYFHKESMQDIRYSQLRCANFIKYASLRSPKDELTFHKGKGVGRFLSFLVNKFLIQSPVTPESEVINPEIAQKVISYINSMLERLEMLRLFKIQAKAESNVSDLIYRILCMKDSKDFDIQNTGHGIQFLVLVVLAIMEKIMYIIENEKRQECIFIKDDKRIISLILGLDEPEIHLHPYMQRSLIGYIQRIINNQDKEFLALLKDLFNIDEINGQIVIVTHSPNVVSGDYKSIIRFYPNDKHIEVKSGQKINLDSQVEKHLLKNLPYIKEAFFSRCVILVEGDTECGAMSLWAEIIGCSFDKLGISAIKVNGGQSIPNVSKLLQEFDINNVSIIDKDIYDLKPANFNGVPNLKTTIKRDFEEELLSTLIASGKEDLLAEVIKEYDEEGFSFNIQKSRLRIISEKYNLAVTWTEKDYNIAEILASANNELKQVAFLSWLNSKKSIVLGRFIGEKIDSTSIPDIYKEVIGKAKSLSQCQQA